MSIIFNFYQNILQLIEKLNRLKLRPRTWSMQSQQKSNVQACIYEIINAQACIYDNVASITSVLILSYQG